MKNCQSCGAKCSRSGCEYCGGNAKSQSGKATIELTHVPGGLGPISNWKRRKIEVKHQSGNHNYVSIPIPKDGFNSVTVFESEGSEWVPPYYIMAMVDNKGRITIAHNFK